MNDYGLYLGFKDYSTTCMYMVACFTYLYVHVCVYFVHPDETLRQQVVSLLKKQERRAVSKHKDKAAADSHTNGRIKDQR